MKLIFIALISIFLITATDTFAKKKEKVIQITGQYAYAAPKGDMKKYFEEGQGGRVDLFGGIKVPIIGAVGLGLDFTYLKFKAKESDDKYEIFQWDWFTLPVPSIFIFDFDAGLFWNVINVKLSQYDYRQVSIRPGFYVQGGIHIPLFTKFVMLKGDVRYG